MEPVVVVKLVVCFWLNWIVGRVLHLSAYARFSAGASGDRSPRPTLLVREPLARFSPPAKVGRFVIHPAGWYLIPESVFKHVSDFPDLIGTRCPVGTRSCRGLAELES